MPHGIADFRHRYSGPYFLRASEVLLRVHQLLRPGTHHSSVSHTRDDGPENLERTVYALLHKTSESSQI
jgi:hypothetical protein